MSKNDCHRLQLLHRCTPANWPVTGHDFPRQMLGSDPNSNTRPLTGGGGLSAYRRFCATSASTLNEGEPPAFVKHCQSAVCGSGPWSAGPLMEERPKMVLFAPPEPCSDRGRKFKAFPGPARDLAPPLTPY
jgi:hypothetical protein